MGRRGGWFPAAEAGREASLEVEDDVFSLPPFHACPGGGVGVLVPFVSGGGGGSHGKFGLVQGRVEMAEILFVVGKGQALGAAAREGKAGRYRCGGFGQGGGDGGWEVRGQVGGGGAVGAGRRGATVAGEAGRGRLVTAAGAGLVDGRRASRGGERDAEGGGFGDQLLLNGGVGGRVGMAEHLAAVVVVAELGRADGDGRIGVVGREGHRRRRGGVVATGPADQSLVGMTMAEWMVGADFGRCQSEGLGSSDSRHQTAHIIGGDRTAAVARWLRIKDGDGHGMGGDEEWERGWGVYPCTTYKRGRRDGVSGCRKGGRLGWRVPSRHLGGVGYFFVCGFDFWLCFLGFGRQRRCDAKRKGWPALEAPVITGLA